MNPGISAECRRHNVGPIAVTPERFRELRRLFDDALLQPPGVRAAWLADACGDDPKLRRQLEALLAADLTTGAAASRALFLVKPDGAPSDPPLEGRRIGHYTLGPEIGRGGMSVVYRATRTDRLFSREVAVKVVRADAADAERLKRFEQEREIVARLDHPNIARLLDGGTTDEGLHYSVIEYVEGERIDGYCDARQLDVHGRVALVRTICDAVQYAHQHLVIHRDLKPSNILVTGDGQVKLLDFGIAKLLEPGVEDTMNPAGRLMTVAYASPEQMKGERVSTQSDIYSLGVILYELLAGRRPHGGGTATPYELARAVCDEEPRPPSVAARELGAARASRLDAELDAIVLMALRKEPERRYASAASLDDDLRRYLAGLPVVAQPDSLRYRAHKFVQRHRAGVWVAAAGAVLIAASLLGMTWQARVAQVERARAEEQQPARWRNPDARRSSRRPRTRIAARPSARRPRHDSSSRLRRSSGPRPSASAATRPSSASGPIAGPAISAASAPRCWH
jgi:serine/threonine protein kinase